MRSRITRIEEKKTIKQLYVVSAILLGFVIIVATLGIPLLIRLSTWAGTNNNNIVESGDKTPPLPPILIPVTIATNSATTKIEGYAEPDSTLKLFLNEEQAKKALLGSDGNFSFSDIQLQVGKNTIYATTTDHAKNESGRSQTLTISYNKLPPKLEITDPQENQTFPKNQQQINIQGKTDPDVQIHINDRFVLVKDDGSFAFSFKLADGENVLHIVARDQAGNEIKIERKVTYSP